MVGGYDKVDRFFLFLVYRGVGLGWVGVDPSPAVCPPRSLPAMLTMGGR